MVIHYFHCAEGYLAVTDETPAGPLRGLVFVGRGPTPGGGIDTICEQAYAKDTLDKLPECPADKVPDEWFVAFGYEKRLPANAPSLPQKPPQPPKPLPEPDWPKLTRPRRKRRKLKADPQVVELVIGSSCETPVLNSIMWLVLALIVSGILLLGRA